MSNHSLNLVENKHIFDSIFGRKKCYLSLIKAFKPFFEKATDRSINDRPILGDCLIYKLESRQYNICWVPLTKSLLRWPYFSLPGNEPSVPHLLALASRLRESAELFQSDEMRPANDPKERAPSRVRMLNDILQDLEKNFLVQWVPPGFYR